MAEGNRGERAGAVTKRNTKNEERKGSRVPLKGRCQWVPAFLFSMKRIKTIDAEVAGEAVRLIVDGGPSVPWDDSSRVVRVDLADDAEGIC
jgi:hypothetical protein